MLRISLLGLGRMGREILAAMAGQPDLRLHGAWVRTGSDLDGADLAAMPGESGEAGRGIVATSRIDDVLNGADVAIDFSLPEANREILAASFRAGTPLVCGVSGLGDDDLAAMRDAARAIPVFYDRNMSIGVAVMRRLVAQSASLLGPEFRADIHDTHHAHKRDAPSGTALLLGESVAGARGQDFRQVMQYPAGRLDAEHSPGDIRFHVTREGEHPGQHTVTFSDAAEQLSIVHDVRNRRVFAAGALRAARWLAARPAGWYGMNEFLENLADKD